MKRIVLLLLIAVSCSAAQEQFKSSHQQDWEFYRDNPHLVGTTVASPSLSKRGDLAKVQGMEKIVYGFHPYWQNGSESNYYFSMLTHVAYFSANINPSTGGFTTTNSWASANVVTLAKQYGVKVHLCLTLFDNHSTLLSSTTAKYALIQNTLTQLAVRNADGVNIDFEAVSSTLRDSFRGFMRQFGDSLKAHGYEFVIELPAVDWSSISDGVGVFDATFFAALNPVTDYYFCMLYDYWWSGSATAGPNSPLLASNNTSIRHVLRSVDRYLTTGCPANKFIAGFPSYGRDWRVKSTAPLADTLGSSPSVSRTFSVVKNNYIDTIPANRQYWSTTYNTRYYNYVSDGNWRQTWYDDSTSWGMKFDSIKVKNVAGTGMWALGYDGSETDLWGALKHAFATTVNPSHTSLDDFENGTGHFLHQPTYSGTTTGISGSSTSARSNDIANNGWASLQVVLKDDAAVAGDWTVRLVSGGGTPASNTTFQTTGYLGFWLKTSSAPIGAEVSLSVDDAAGGTLISSRLPVNSDGDWHLYEWNLPAVSWTILTGMDTILNGPTATLDALMFYAPNASPDWTMNIDDVSHNPTGPLPVGSDRRNPGGALPDKLILGQNFPNPFNPVTTIQFSVPDNMRSETISLTVHDILGRVVTTLANEKMEAGIHSMQWNAAGHGSGVYFYTLRAGVYSETKKLLLMK
jgi:spore germination protein YaaH